MGGNVGGSEKPVRHAPISILPLLTSCSLAFPYAQAPQAQYKSCVSVGEEEAKIAEVEEADGGTRYELRGVPESGKARLEALFQVGCLFYLLSDSQLLLKLHGSKVSGKRQMVASDALT